MAYAAVASLSHTINLILMYHQHSISPRFKNQIISLQKYIIYLESFLEYDPERANNWEETIREVTDWAEQTVEHLLSDSVMEVELDSNFHELESVTKEIKSIAKSLKSGRRIEAVGGSDGELMEIISRLRRGSSSLEKIAIFGMGGIGKTTLAKNAFRNPLIVSHFEICAWYTKSQELTMKEMMVALLHSLHRSSYGNIANSQEELIYRVYRILKGKRYLIVLDDIWSLDDWEMLRFALPDDGNGSRIILTTRSFELAETVGHVHEMDAFDEDKTWNLLREKIFKGDPCPSQLEYVGKEVARKCRGHPLSIEVVSGILAADQTQAAWGGISDNMNINASEDLHCRLYGVLWLSYKYLPHHLRPCFLYLGLFPKDRNIPVSKLVRLWIAEGFLNESECKSLEETGAEHVDDLLQRGLVSVTKWKCNGRIQSIAVHDLIRKCCLVRASLDNFFLQRFNNLYDRQGMAMELQSCRRVSDLIYHDNILDDVYGSTIRTIIGSSPYMQLCSRLLVENVRLLRILDLSNAYYDDLAEELFELFHLRYLAFHREFSISEAISNLQNLQTLIILPCKNDGGMFGELPMGIWRMPQLRHLFIFRFKLPCQIVTAPPLENLQMLSRVVGFICSKENLKMIPHLKKLVLLYPEKLRDVEEDYELHNLIYLQKLEILKIETDWSFKKEHKVTFAFPPTLKKLNLCGVELLWEDMKIVASLPNLQVLKLRKNACIGERWETSEGGFSQLTYLLIHESNLENWITESSHFPRLKCLLLLRCSHLLEVPSDLGKIPTLALIFLAKPSHTLSCSAKRIQEDLVRSGDVRLRLVVV